MRISFIPATVKSFPPPRPKAACLLVLFSIVSVMPVAHAQQTTTTPSTPSLPHIRGPESETAGPLEGRMAEQMAIARNAQRQKQIISESNRLLVLAQNLNADVNKSNKDELSISVVKEAEEIEKLAKSIKDKMRYGD